MRASILLSRLVLVGVACGSALFPVVEAGVSSVEAAAPEKRVKDGGGVEPAYQIRCWQEGKLLFEESDWVLTPEQTKQVMVKAKKQKAEAGVMVIELRNSLCLLKQHN